MKTRRDLRDRVEEYEANLRSLASQLENVVKQVEVARPDVNPGTQELRDTIRLYRLIADDITKILAGQELQPFIITGELPT
jgi:hypothetical protein